MPMWKRGGWNNRGFTLLEITVVLFLLGFIALLVFPRVGRVIGGDLAAATRDLAGTIRFLYEEAAATRRIYRLTSDLTSGEYRSSVEGETKEFILIARRLLPRGVTFADLVTPSQGKVTTGEAIIHFFPDGRTERAVIHLRGREREFYTLFLNPLTGRVRGEEGYVDRVETR